MNSINYDVLLAEPAKTAKSVMKVKVSKASTTYYSAGTDEVARVAFGVGLLSTSDETMDAQVAATWYLTLFELAFPGVLETVAKTHSKKVEMSADNVSQYLEGESIGGLPDPGKTDSLSPAANLLSLTGVVATLTFAIGKQPTPDNVSAFRERRTKAFTAKVGMAEGDLGLLDPSLMPELFAYQAVHRAMATVPHLRRALVEELLGWIDNDDATPEMAAVGAIVKLWEGAGMNHVALIRKFLASYGDIAFKINGLRPEIRLFVRQYDAWAQNNKDGVFSKVLNGDRKTTLASRDFPELLKLAREFALRMDPKLGQYASSLGDSSFVGVFEKLADKEDVPYPQKVANPEQ